MTAAKKQKRGVVTKERILDVSSQLFYRKGYHTTTLDDIARELSVTKPSLYYHFPSKEGILLAVIDCAVDSLVESVKRRDPKHLCGRKRVESFLYCYLELICHDVGVSTVLTDDRLMSPEGQARYDEYRRQINHKLEELVELGKSDGSIDVDDVKLTTYAIFGLFNSIAHWNFNFDKNHVAEIFETFISILFDGLGSLKKKCGSGSSPSR